MPDGPGTDLMVGVQHGDDGAVVRVSPAMAVVVTADFFTPVVDDAYTFGRIAATNALSDIYATGIADPAALLRIDAGQGLPLSLTKPIGTGGVNAWHKATGQVSAAAVEVMTTLNATRAGGRWPPGSGARRRDRVRLARPPVQAGPGQRGLRGGRPRGSAAHRRHPGGGAGRAYPGRKLAEPAMGAPAHRPGRGRCAGDLLLLADARTSGGLLVAGELPGAPVIGELVRRRDSVLIIR